MTVYGYARVSSRSQEDGFGLEVQRAQLVAAGAEKIYEEVYTGTTMDRPKWDELFSLMVPGDTLVVAKLDRIARTASGGCAAVRDLVERGIAVRALNMGLVEDTPFGRMVLTVMFAMAEFDRDMLVERMAEGKAAARKRPGYREGRPRLVIDEEAFSKLARMHAAGKISGREAARRLGVSERTWRRRLEEEACHG